DKRPTRAPRHPTGVSSGGPGGGANGRRDRTRAPHPGGRRTGLSTGGSAWARVQGREPQDLRGRPGQDEPVAARDRGRGAGRSSVHPLRGHPTGTEAVLGGGRTARRGR